MTVLPFRTSRCFAPGYPKRPSLKPSPAQKGETAEFGKPKFTKEADCEIPNALYGIYDVCAKKMRPGIKSSLRICQLGKANKTERLFRGCKDGVSDVLLLTSAKEVSRTGKRQRCGLSFFALWGLFPLYPCPVCTFICALAP
ncbi:hypothetical protein J3E69DRAFT_341745, partial [Trichoderma sp. SZMC 28015]